MFDWHRFGDDARESGRAILSAGVVPGPPAGPFVEGRAYPLAVDVDGSSGAVSYATLNPYPDIAPGWWCVAEAFRLADGVWHDDVQDDNLTSQRPFERPAAAEESTDTWTEWHSNGALASSDGDEPRTLHMFFGIAPTPTARLTVTDETGRERDLAITPWCGGYVATVEGAYSRLTGYGHDGRRIDSFVCRDGDGSGPDPDPPPGWERVEWVGDGEIAPLLWRRVDAQP